MILGKYLAWLSSTTVAVALGWTVLPKGFVEVANWIGPLLGPSFKPLLTLVFLFVGPSLSYTPLLTVWVSAGVVGGFFARGVLRSMIAGTLSTITLILLAVANGFLLISGIRNLVSGSGGFNLPPPPPGTSLADILSVPVVGQIVQQATSPGGPSLLGIASVLAVNFGLNIALFAGSFIGSGVMFRKIFHRRAKPVKPRPVEDSMPKPPTPPGSIPPVATPSAPAPAPTATVLSLLVIALLILGTVVPAGLAQSSGSSGVLTGEQMELGVQKDGSLRMVYSTNVSSLPGVSADYSRAEFQNLVAGSIFSFNGSVQVGAGGPPSFLLSLLPRHGFLAIYQVSDPQVGKGRADVLASEFAQGFAVSLQPAVSLVLPSFGGQQGSSGSIYLGIYEGGQQNTTLRMLGLVQSDGVGTILTPRKVFAGSYAIMAGFLGFENASATPSPSVSVVADLTGFSNFYGRGTFTLGLRETFGAQGTIAPSATAKTTQIRLEFPTNSTVVAWGPSTATVNSTQGLYQLLLNTTSSPTPNAFVTFDASFPQRIHIDRRTDPSSTVSAGATVTEKVSVRNLGNETIHGVVVSEKKLFQTYPTLELLSPSYNSTLGDIDPQASREATVQFRVGSNGVYTMPSAEVSYVDQNKTISRESSQTMLVSTFNLELYLGKLVSGTAPYSYPLVGLVVLTPVKSLIGGIGKLSTRRRKKTR
ncbi:hypothetical protein AUG19_04565 [archaeon 13_1_20CM_2_54_9]|nr:MAG: hypothetical protein AUJ07_09240 [Crenarchaeota archaeon 13_1_40CM_3_53_5]OLE75804.1 MAG: hypothetical protein AUG19_04565 [archaeon 13_1_20CM_2_54_9]